MFFLGPKSVSLDVKNLVVACLKMQLAADATELKLRWPFFKNYCFRGPVSNLKVLSVWIVDSQ